MKKSCFKWMLVALMPVMFASCSSDNDEPETKLEPAPYVASAQKISLSSNAVVGGVQYKSIEFTESGKYIIRTNTAPEADRNPQLQDAAAGVEEIITGTYTVDGNVYTLPNYATITVSVLGTSVNLNIKLASGGELTTAGVLVAKIALNLQTQNLCRTWTIARTEFRYIEQDASGKEKAPVGAVFTGCNLEEMGNWLLKEHDVDIMDQLAKKRAVRDITFTSSKTYQMTFANGEISIGDWNWKNVTNGTISYTWDDPDTMGNNFENGDATVKFDGAYGVLSLGGNVTTNHGGTKYRVTMTFTLK
ncbi:MAG: hypothetical protein IJ244_07400 [Bacteroidaceae bacterium]|nr:hypothetical protein [Bacteroidaceae bacterium]